MNYVSLANDSMGKESRLIVSDMNDSPPPRTNSKLIVPKANT